MKLAIGPLISLVLLVATSPVEAQHKSPAKSSAKKQTHNTAKPEIDRLYDKYKGSETVTIYTPHGELTSDVVIRLADNNKPAAITLAGASESQAAVAEFIAKTVKMKLNQGYKPTRKPFFWNAAVQGAMSFIELVEQGLGSGFKEENSFQLLLRKGNMYFKADAGCCARDAEGNYVTQTLYNWEITTGDSKREAGANSSNFEF